MSFEVTHTGKTTEGPLTSPADFSSDPWELMILVVAVDGTLSPYYTVTVIEAEEEISDYDIIIDLSVGSGDIYVYETGKVLIKGISNGDRTIFIEIATEIYIANVTTIRGASNDPIALFVPDNTTITGLGSNITITGGTGFMGHGGGGIYALGDLTINGTLGAISGGEGTDYNGGNGIYAAGTITINGTLGNISGGDSPSYNGGNGIYAEDSITISGTTGVISGGDCDVRGGNGIFIPGSGTFTISGMVGSNNTDSIRGGIGGTQNGSQINIDGTNYEFPPPGGSPPPWIYP